MQWHAGREHVRGANVCLSVCRPTPLLPRALAAVLIARSAFLGSTAVPRSVVKTRPEDSALERPRTKDVRRATSPFDAREVLSVNAAGGVYGNWARQVLPATARRGDDRQTFPGTVDVPLAAALRVPNWS
jgi:hypothetical protein